MGLMGAFLVGTASAAFPGRNGRISYIANRKAGLDGYPIVSVRPQGGHDRLLTRPFDIPATSDAYNPDGQKIAFDAGSTGNAIYIKQVGGRRHARRLTRRFSSPGDDFAPNWSPDGQSIVFERLYYGQPPRTGACAGADVADTCIRIYHRGRSRAVVLLASGGRPVWSVRNLIAYGDADGSISIIRPDGSGRRRLANTGGGIGPDWSPDGRRLVFSTGTLMTVGANGHHLRDLGRDGQEPAFSPDGRKIVYETLSAGNKKTVLRTIDLRGGGVRVVQTRHEVFSADPTPLDWQPLPRH
jgi:Tol biopolymer transport system component